MGLNVTRLASGLPVGGDLESADEITVYKSMGHAVEDLVAAQLVHERASREGVGTLVDL